MLYANDDGCFTYLIGFAALVMAIGLISRNRLVFTLKTIHTKEIQLKT